MGKHNRILTGITIVSAAAVSAVYGCYRAAFGVNKIKLPKYNKIPPGEQYEVRRDRMTELLETAVKIPYEDVYTFSRDGLKLHARLYRGREGAPVQIMFHGFRSNSIRDFSGGMQYGIEMGHTVVLVDQRAHGESEGDTLGYGVLERHDCLSWIDFVIENIDRDAHIYLVGLSMGATTVLMASDLNLPANVRGIIADCGFTSPREIITKVVGEMRPPLPSNIVYELARTGARIFCGFDPDSVSAPQSLNNAKVPVLFIHGEDDRFVPCEMSLTNFDACTTSKVIFTVPEAGHGISYILDEPGYKMAVKSFVEECEKNI